MPVTRPDLYARLATRHIRRGDAIITFNYDLAVERALRTAGLWEIGDGYGFPLGDTLTPASHVKVLKLHGRTNWLGQMFGGALGFSQVSSVYDPRPVLHRESDFCYLGYTKSNRDPMYSCTSRTGGEPALILPTRHKDFFHQTPFGHEWEPFWSHIWGQAADVLHSSEKMIIIGYSMPEADERAMRLLLRSSKPAAEINVFSGSRTQAICESFREAGFRSMVSQGKGRFEDFLSH